MSFLEYPPYLFSGYGTYGYPIVLGGDDYKVVSGWGQLPAPVITSWAGLQPAFSVIVFTFSGEVVMSSPSNLVQAVWQDPSSGEWHYGGYSAYTSGDETYWSFDDWGSLGDPPVTSPPAPSDGVTGFTSLFYNDFSIAGSGGALGLNGPPNVFLCASVTQGGPSGDFWLIAFDGTAQDGPPSSFSAWERPPTIADYILGGGGPTIGASDFLSPDTTMFVAGPLAVTIENGYGFVVGVQNPGGDMFIFFLAQNYPGGYAGGGDYGPWCYNTDAPACPGGGGIVPGQLSLNTSRGGTQPIESCIVLWAYQPNADGTFTAWYLNYGDASWTELDAVFDVQCCTGGFQISADNSTITLVGYSPSYGCNVALSYDIATATLTHLAGSVPGSLMLDGYPTSNPGFTPTIGGAPATQKSTMIDPVAAYWPYLADEATAEYYFDDIGSPVAGGWLREVVTNTIYGKPAATGISPLRMFQRSDAWGLRMVQAHGSANSPLSLRNYGSGNSHV